MKTPALLLLLSLAAGSGGAVAQRESPAEPAPPSPEVSLKTAEAHLTAGRIEPALASLREVLMQTPDNHDVRLRLSSVLIDRQRYGEALPELQRVLAARPDIAAHSAWLRALDAAGAPLERALAAEEAVRRHPEHVPFAWAAIEALVGMSAHDLALGYWRKLPKAEQASPLGQYLLGTLHEAAGRLAEALAAYRAARDEPRAKAALVRLRGHALNLGGALYFPPAGWSLQPGEPRRLMDTRTGLLATPNWLARDKPPEALRNIIGQKLLLQADYPLEQILSGKYKPAKETSPPDPLSIERFVCPGQRPMLCVEVGPRKEFVGLLPRFHAGAVDLRSGTLVVLLEGAERSAASGILRTLGDALLQVDGGQP
jgi:tetratricopeptide (TPR) repeat protein